MNLFEAQRMTLDLMKVHNLWNWTFDWHNKKIVFGTCNHTKQIIYLSKALVLHMEVNAVKNTILHEIAHALVGSGNGHNYIWERKAIEIGCDGNRTNNYESVNKNVVAKYIGICNCCGKKYKMHRLPKRHYSCPCKGSRYNSELRLEFIQQY